ncbi:hypothetical protein ACFXGI_11430 [Streptomyces sp. NPDC059355]|uniref:hypothetical protein n=1 Tax=Streptomyces sp. NPDC059355 TaxID=3346811 RepID=UPI0036B034D0
MSRWPSTRGTRKPLPVGRKRAPSSSGYGKLPGSYAQYGSAASTSPVDPYAREPPHTSLNSHRPHLPPSGDGSRSFVNSAEPG